MWVVKCTYLHATYNNKTSDLRLHPPFSEGRAARETELDVKCSNFIDI